MSYVDDVINYIGHSLYTADPHEDLNLIEFRIYNGALSPADVAASQTLGPSEVLGSSPKPGLTASVASGSFVISWPVSGRLVSRFIPAARLARTRFGRW